MNNTSGFYKLDAGSLLYGALVCGPTYTLIASEQDAYEYPVEGWHWFGSEAEARAFFGLEQP